MISKDQFCEIRCKLGSLCSTNQVQGDDLVEHEKSVGLRLRLVRVCSTDRGLPTQFEIERGSAREGDLLSILSKLILSNTK